MNQYDKDELLGDLMGLYSALEAGIDFDHARGAQSAMNAARAIEEMATTIESVQLALEGRVVSKRLAMLSDGTLRVSTRDAMSEEQIKDAAAEMWRKTDERNAKWRELDKEKAALMARGR